MSASKKHYITESCAKILKSRMYTVFTARAGLKGRQGMQSPRPEGAPELGPQTFQKNKFIIETIL